MSEFGALDIPANQSLFGRLVGLSQPAIKSHIDKGVLVDNGTLLDWLRQLLTHYREQAAGRSGDDQMNLSRARIREAEANAQLKELQFFKEVGALVPLESIEPTLEQWAVVARSEIGYAVDKIITGIHSQHNIEVDQGLIDAALQNAFNAISDYPKNLVEVGGESGNEMVATEKSANTGVVSH